MKSSRRSSRRVVYPVLLVLVHGPLWAGSELRDGGFEDELTGGTDEPGWEITTYGQEVAQDRDVYIEGFASLRIVATSKDSSTMLRQTLLAESIRNGGIRLLGRIRTENVQGTATLFVIVEDAEKQIFVDDMRGRPVQGDSEWTQVEIRVPRLVSAETVDVGVVMIGSGIAWFDELVLIESEIGNSMSAEAAEYLEAALDIVEQRSIHGADADWESLREEARVAAAGSQSPEDIYPTIQYVLRRLDDTHSSLFTPERALRVTTEGAGSTDLPRWTSPKGAVLNVRFAYIDIPKYSGTNPDRMTAYADELQDRIRDLDSENICGWIVDVRENLGGNVFPMLAGIGPVLGEGDAGGGIGVDGTEVMRSYADGRSGGAVVSGRPYELLKPAPPVAVLLGPNTASSGEAVALAFIGRPDTRTFGADTAGYTTGNAPIPLSDGAILNLAVSVMMDRNRNVNRGPISPDVFVDSSHDAGQQFDMVIEKAVSWLGTTTQCAEHAVDD